MLVGVVRETFPGERRVALTPMVVTELRRSGFGVVIEAGAGLGAGFPDRLYAEAGAEVVLDREEVFGRADIIAQVRGYGANPEAKNPHKERTKLSTPQVKLSRPHQPGRQGPKGVG